jgi:hypothetical protein
MLRRAERGRITIRPSRPRVVASAVCFTLRLHTSAAPPRGGLTQALGGSMEPKRKRPVLPQLILLLLAYPIALVALVRFVTAHVQSPWINGAVFIIFTFLFWRVVTGEKTRKIFGRRW